MTQVAYFYRRYGAWIFAAGLFGILVGFSYRAGVQGIVTLVVSAILAISDPVILFLGARKGLEKPQGTLLGAWILGLSGLALYFARALTELAPDAVGGEESLVGRFRAVLLALFLLALVASFAFRLADSLGTSAVEGLRGASATREQFLRSSVLTFIAAIPLFVLINYVSAVRNPTLDLSPGYFSFGQASRTIIKTLNKDVQIYAFLPVQQVVRDSGKGSTRPELFKIAEDVRVMLEQLPIVNSKISITFLNADLDSERSAEFGTTSNGTIVMRVMKPADAILTGDKPYIERRVYVYNEQDMERLERETVRALIQVASPEKAIYFTGSNGERYSFTDKARERGGIETLKNMLRFYNFQVQGLDHGVNWPGPIPDNAAVVFIAGPTTPFGPEARKAILDYLKKNGRLFIAMDPEGDEDFSWLMKELPNNTFAFKRAFLSHIPNLPGIVVTDNTTKHRITENLLIAGRSLVVFPNSGYFDEVKADRDGPKDGVLSGLAITAFLHTMYNTTIDTNHNGRKDAGEASGRYALGLTIEKPAEPAKADKPGEKQQAPPSDKKDSPKIALYAGVGWLTEYGLAFPTDQRNIIMATDTLSWLTESPLAAALVPEKRESRSIQVTDELKFRNMLLGMLIFPVGTALILAVAIAVYRRRRRFVGDE